MKTRAPGGFLVPEAFVGDSCSYIGDHNKP